jgi:putative ABC transport system permease protein
MFSIILIISSIAVYKQLDYIQTKKLGFEKENIIIIKNLIGMYYEDADMSQEDRELQFATLRQEILKNPTVVNSTLMSAMPGNSARNFNISVHPEGTPPDTEHGIPYVKIDGSYTDVFGLEMATGSNFKNELTIPRNIEGVLINEKAAQLFGFENPVGKHIEATLNKRISTENGEKKWVREKEQIPVIGVLKDFHTRDLYQDMISTIFFPQFQDDYFGFFMAVRFMPGSIYENIDFLEKTWQNTGVRQTFEYEFFDKELEGLYRKEIKLNQVVSFFTILAIFIACLGIFGLATLMAVRRTKEIGVRKVNGATINEVMLMLNKNFINRVLLAFIIACPIAYYVMHRWLENFAYRTTLSWWVFVLAGGFTLVIALFTVSWQSWKAAIRNPIEALRDE